MIRRLLVANRGEIARRIIRACRETGVESVAVYSDADVGAVHAREADRAVRIGPAAAAESYLSIPNVIDAARRAGADALHPGYGFLSENADLAEACTEAGLVFVGPPASAIRAMGSKVNARQTVERAGVPITPGDTPADQSESSIRDAARRVGLPVLIKASKGGGGIGMRAVRRDDELAAAIGAARREAAAAFGDGALHVERLLERPRHVEIQVFGDAHGRIVHLFERECSIQRRRQKIIEESPSPALTPALREAMGRAAIRAAESVGYRNAGTVEFLLESAGGRTQFYFLEMNTRLQVEHPVTEAVTGVDLVTAQIRVAQGDPLPWSQASLAQRGHAIECRIYAESPEDDFLPQAGPLLLYREPTGPGIRVDSGVVQGDEVRVEYDPLLAKLVASAETREAAIRRAVAALDAFPVLGVRTNIPFLKRVLRSQRFAAGAVDIGFVEDERRTLLAAPSPPPAAIAAAAAARPPGIARGVARMDVDPWSRREGWRP
jgi:acetyl-CoA carboxylase biotin carboxylase subunit